MSCRFSQQSQSNELRGNYGELFTNIGSTATPRREGQRTVYLNHKSQTTCFPKHHLDAAGTDFHNSFPQLNAAKHVKASSSQLESNAVLFLIQRIEEIMQIESESYT